MPKINVTKRAMKKETLFAEVRRMRDILKGLSQFSKAMVLASKINDTKQIR